MATVLLAGVDGEHLRAARGDGLGLPGRRASLGTDFWSESPAERLENLPTGIEVYFYVVTRGLEESRPEAQWAGTFEEYRRGEGLSAAEWQATRPSTAKRRHDDFWLPLDQQEPDWAGYLLVSGLHELDHPVPLGRFRVQGRPFRDTVVRHPMLAELP